MSRRKFSPPGLPRRGDMYWVEGSLHLVLNVEYVGWVGSWGTPEEPADSYPVWRVTLLGNCVDTKLWDADMAKLWKECVKS